MAYPKIKLPKTAEKAATKSQQFLEGKQVNNTNLMLNTVQLQIHRMQSFIAIEVYKINRTVVKVTNG